MKIAITAASGHLGTEIVKATVALVSKENVIGLARTPDKAKNLGIEIRPGDYNDKGNLEKSLQSVDTLLLVSGMDAPEKRIEQHRNVIQAALEQRCKKDSIHQRSGSRRRYSLFAYHPKQSTD